LSVGIVFCRLGFFFFFASATISFAAAVICSPALAFSMATSLASSGTAGAASR
jgi:hypothetical protein